MKQYVTITNRFGHTTVFAHSEASAWLARLWDLECGLGEADTGPVPTRGLCLLETDRSRYEADDFQLTEFQSNENSVAITWLVSDIGLRWKSHWHVHQETGIWSRQDTLENTAASAIEIRRCLLRIAFSPGQYEIYTQSSNWAHENQGHWNEFFSGRLTIGSRSGRTTQIANPYLFVREKGGDHGIGFHILPHGNWSIHVDRSNTVRDEFSTLNVIELGLSDNTLRMQLEPGRVLVLPEILIQDVPAHMPEAGVVHLHRYWIENKFENKKIAPVVFNTWFDQFDSLQVERLRKQLAIARTIGCEVFMIDAGWYGRNEGDWHRQVGDWREKLNGAFHGQMTKFADEVRAAGLGFGLWVEPERNSPNAPVVQEHPEWFLSGLGGFFYPDLSQPAVYQYIFSELSRLAETYQLAWMKVDFNFELGYSDDELYGYFEHWYWLMDELRKKYPGTFFEGCASGGMRLDLNTLSHFDAHFLSDTVNPVDVLRITQGAMLRLPPGQITKWAVLRALDDQIFTPGGGSWDNAVTADVDFICRAALPGMLGISGDLIDLPINVLARLQSHIVFYKQWREFIRGSTCHLLTPIGRLDDRSGWIAFQLQNALRADVKLLFVYRLLDGQPSRSFRLMEIHPAQTYTVTHIDAADSPRLVSGSDLHSLGLTVDLPHPNHAVIIIIREIPS